MKLNKIPRDTRWDEIIESDDYILPEQIDKSTNVWVVFGEELQKGHSICEKRVSVDKIIDEPAGIRREGDVMIVPVMQEQLVLVKKLVLKEEIHLWTEDDC